MPSNHYHDHKLAIVETGLIIICPSSLPHHPLHCQLPSPLLSCPPPPPPSPSTFADKSPVSISLMEPLEWDQSTADVDEWIARVKNHSDKIAEEMFERAGLSPPNSVSNADLRFLSRDAATTPPAHYNTAEELAIYEQNQPLENETEI